jgi:hypothetical protein
VWFDTAALILILAAQIYAIARSETLLRRERDLHEKIEDFLGGLTPAGLWPQYESLKKFYQEAADSLRVKEEELQALKDTSFISQSQWIEQVSALMKSEQLKLEAFQRNVEKALAEVQAERESALTWKATGTVRPSVQTGYRGYSGWDKDKK